MKRAAGVALAGALLTLTAFVFDASPLFVVGVALVVVAGASVLWVWATARGATIERRLSADRVVEDEPLEATVIVRRGRLGVPRVQVLDPLAGAPIALEQTLSFLHGRGEADLRLLARFSRRGLRQLAPPSLCVQDGLELARVTRTSSGPTQSLLVLPRTEPVRWLIPAHRPAAEGSGASAAHEPLALADVDGLRPYRTGTPASRIHWPALARGAGLLERRLRADSDSRPLIILDARCDGPSDLLDAAVRAAASLALDLARRGGCRLLLPGERRPAELEPELAAWPSLHARLALVESGPATRPPVLGPGARLGPIFYVAARPLERVPVALTGPGEGTCVIVLPAGLRHIPTAAPSLEVAGCRGHVVGTRSGRIRERVA